MFIDLAWRLDQRFIDILKKVLPLQEQLHTLKYIFINFSYSFFKDFLLNIVSVMLVLMNRQLMD